MLPNFDPSQLDPKVMMELSQLVQQLPPEKLNQMQTLMHNMMAGHDVRREMEDFEKSLPPGFREKLARLMYAANGVDVGAEPPVQSTISGLSQPSAAVEMPGSMREARLTVLRAVAEGRMSAEQAEGVLWPSG